MHAFSEAKRKKKNVKITQKLKLKYREPESVKIMAYRSYDYPCIIYGKEELYMNCGVAY